MDEVHLLGLLQRQHAEHIAIECIKYIIYNVAHEDASSSMFTLPVYLLTPNSHSQASRSIVPVVHNAISSMQALMPVLTLISSSQVDANEIPASFSLAT